MTREEVEALLPFLANGTLEGDERAEVEAFVESDPELLAELRALSTIRVTMQAEDDVQSPGEFGLARLMSEVEREPVTAPPKSGEVFWRAAAVVLLAAFVGQFVYMANDGTPPGDYQLAGDQAAELTITVSPLATEQELREVLLAAGVEIVSGPSAIGLYGLATLEGVTPEDAKNSLLSASAIIQSVELSE